MPNSDERNKRPLLAHILRWFAVPVIIAWVALTVIVNVAVPQLEVVGELHSAPMAPEEAPSMVAMARMGKNFQEFDSNSMVMIVLEGQDKLGDAAHRYYDGLIEELSKDHEHVQHMQDFWGERLTAAGVQSSDAKAAYVQLNLAGQQGTTLANESVEAVRKVIDDSTPPDGVRAYVAGGAALSDDMHVIGNNSLATITSLTLVAIFVMLLVVYRSLVTTLVQMFVTLLDLAVARGVVAVLGWHDVMRLTTFATNILTMLAIAAGTDYGIFLIGRYQEARAAGEDRVSAYYTTVRSVTPVVLGSGLTIAGANFCLSFTRLPYFKTMGIPVSIGMLVVVAAALTLGPAVLVVCSRFGLLEPKGVGRSKLWHRVGTAVVRWPAPIMVASGFLVMIGLVMLPGSKPGYNDQYYLPDNAKVNVAYAAATRHFTQARMNPDLLMVESDHDMRNTADMLVLDRVAKNIMRVNGIAMIQSITRPLGIPIQHSSIPFVNSMQSQLTMQNMDFLRDRMNDMVKMADQQQITIDYMQHMLDITQRLSNTTHTLAGVTDEMVVVTDNLRDHMANFDDQWRPMRNYFYWEPHCFDIPMCWSFRSLFDALDGIDELDEKFLKMSNTTHEMDALQQEMVTILPPAIASAKTTKALTLTMHSTMLAMLDQMDTMSNTAIVMGQSFDDSKNDDLFYLPPEAFDNPDFQIGLRQFMSPDGKSARFFITHEGDPASLEGISHVEPTRMAAQQALKMSSLSDAKIFLGGQAATYKDMRDGARYDLIIAVVASLTLIFLIMMLLTRSLVAALVIVFTASSSIAASLGISVLIWQDILHMPIHWVTQVLAIIVLLAVGSDYNLLLVSRFTEEIHAGLKTGYLRAIGGSGGVVTAAGMVFAATMAAMLGSELTVLGQFGSTVAIGLLLDTWVVRSFFMPSIAMLLGRWFWWPRVVHPRGDNANRTFRSSPPPADDTDRIPVPAP